MDYDGSSDDSDEQLYTKALGRASEWNARKAQQEKLTIEEICKRKPYLVKRSDFLNVKVPSIVKVDFSFCRPEGGEFADATKATIMPPEKECEKIMQVLRSSQGHAVLFSYGLFDREGIGKLVYCHTIKKTKCQVQAEIDWFDDLSILERYDTVEPINIDSIKQFQHFIADNPFKKVMPLVGSVSATVDDLASLCCDRAFCDTILIKFGEIVSAQQDEYRVFYLNSMLSEPSRHGREAHTSGLTKFVFIIHVKHDEKKSEVGIAGFDADIGNHYTFCVMTIANDLADALYIDGLGLEVPKALAQSLKQFLLGYFQGSSVQSTTIQITTAHSPDKNKHHRCNYNCALYPKHISTSFSGPAVIFGVSLCLFYPAEFKRLTTIKRSDSGSECIKSCISHLLPDLSGHSKFLRFGIINWFTTQRVKIEHFLGVEKYVRFARMKVPKKPVEACEMYTLFIDSLLPSLPQTVKSSSPGNIRPIPKNSGHRSKIKNTPRPQKSLSEAIKAHVESLSRLTKSSPASALGSPVTTTGNSPQIDNTSVVSETTRTILKKKSATVATPSDLVSASPAASTSSAPEITTSSKTFAVKQNVSQSMKEASISSPKATPVTSRSSSVPFVAVPLKPIRLLQPETAVLSSPITTNASSLGSLSQAQIIGNVQNALQGKSATANPDVDPECKCPRLVSEGLSVSETSPGKDVCAEVEYTPRIGTRSRSKQSPKGTSMPGNVSKQNESVKVGNAIRPATAKNINKTSNLAQVKSPVPDSSSYEMTTIQHAESKKEADSPGTQKLSNVVMMSGMLIQTSTGSRIIPIQGLKPGAPITNEMIAHAVSNVPELSNLNVSQISVNLNVVNSSQIDYSPSTSVTPATKPMRSERSATKPKRIEVQRAADMSISESTMACIPEMSPDESISPNANVKKLLRKAIVSRANSTGAIVVPKDSSVITAISHNSSLAVSTSSPSKTTNIIAESPNTAVTAASPSTTLTTLSLGPTNAMQSPSTTVTASSPSSTDAAPSLSTAVGTMSPSTTVTASSSSSTVAAPSLSTAVGTMSPSTTGTAQSSSSTVAAPSLSTAVGTESPSTTVTASTSSSTVAAPSHDTPVGTDSPSTTGTAQSLGGSAGDDKSGKTYEAVSARKPVVVGGGKVLTVSAQLMKILKENPKAKVTLPNGEELKVIWGKDSSDASIQVPSAASDKTSPAVGESIQGSSDDTSSAAASGKPDNKAPAPAANTSENLTKRAAPVSTTSPSKPKKAKLTFQSFGETSLTETMQKQDAANSVKGAQSSVENEIELQMQLRVQSKIAEVLSGQPVVCYDYMLKQLKLKVQLNGLPSLRFRKAFPCENIVMIEEARQVAQKFLDGADGLAWVQGLVDHHRVVKASGSKPLLSNILKTEPVLRFSPPNTITLLLDPQKLAVESLEKDFSCTPAGFQDEEAMGKILPFISGSEMMDWILKEHKSASLSKTTSAQKAKKAALQYARSIPLPNELRTFAKADCSYDQNSKLLQLSVRMLADPNTKYKKSFCCENESAITAPAEQYLKSEEGIAWVEGIAENFRYVRVTKDLRKHLRRDPVCWFNAPNKLILTINTKKDSPCAKVVHCSAQGFKDEKAVAEIRNFLTGDEGKQWFLEKFGMEAELADPNDPTVGQLMKLSEVLPSGFQQEKKAKVQRQENLGPKGVVRKVTSGSEMETRAKVRRQENLGPKSFVHEMECSPEVMELLSRPPQCFFDVHAKKLELRVALTFAKLCETFTRKFPYEDVESAHAVEAFMKGDEGLAWVKELLARHRIIKMPKKLACFLTDCTVLQYTPPGKITAIVQVRSRGRLRKDFSCTVEGFEDKAAMATITNFFDGNRVYAWLRDEHQMTLELDFENATCLKDLLQVPYKIQFVERPQRLGIKPALRVRFHFKNAKFLFKCFDCNSEGLNDAEAVAKIEDFVNGTSGLEWARGHASHNSAASNTAILPQWVECGTLPVGVETRWFFDNLKFDIKSSISTKRLVERQFPNNNPVSVWKNDKWGTSHRTDETYVLKEESDTPVLVVSRTLTCSGLTTACRTECGALKSDINQSIEQQHCLACNELLFTESDLISCTHCGIKAVDVRSWRKMDNMMLCNGCHNYYSKHKRLRPPEILEKYKLRYQPKFHHKHLQCQWMMKLCLYSNDMDNWKVYKSQNNEFFHREEAYQENKRPSQTQRDLWDQQILTASHSSHTKAITKKLKSLGDKTVSAKRVQQRIKNLRSSRKIQFPVSTGRAAIRKRNKRHAAQALKSEVIVEGDVEVPTSESIPTAADLDDIVVYEGVEQMADTDDQEIPTISAEDISQGLEEQKIVILQDHLLCSLCVAQKVTPPYTCSNSDELYKHIGAGHEMKLFSCTTCFNQGMIESFISEQELTNHVTTSHAMSTEDLRRHMTGVAIKPNMSEEVLTAIDSIIHADEFVTVQEQQQNQGGLKRKMKQESVILKRSCVKDEDIRRCGECKEETNAQSMCCDNCSTWYHWQCISFTQDQTNGKWFCLKCVQLV